MNNITVKYQYINSHKVHTDNQISARRNIYCGYFLFFFFFSLPSFFINRLFFLFSIYEFSFNKCDEARSTKKIERKNSIFKKIKCLEFANLTFPRIATKYFCHEMFFCTLQTFSRKFRTINFFFKFEKTNWVNKNTKNYIAWIRLFSILNIHSLKNLSTLQQHTRGRTSFSPSSLELEVFSQK